MGQHLQHLKGMILLNFCKHGGSETGLKEQKMNYSLLRNL